MTDATDATDATESAESTAPRAEPAVAPPARGRPKDGERGPWRGVRSALTQRLGYKAAALFFSVVLWLVVSGEETAEQVLPVRLAATVDSSLDVVGAPPAARALVVGRARDLLKLGDGPLVVRRVFPAETPESVRVELRPGDVDLPSAASVVVRDIQPRAVTLHFAPTPAERVRRRAAAESAAAESAAAAHAAAVAAALRRQREEAAAAAASLVPDDFPAPAQGRPARPGPPDSGGPTGLRFPPNAGRRDSARGGAAAPATSATSASPAAPPGSVTQVAPGTTAAPGAQATQGTQQRRDTSRARRDGARPAPR